MLAADHGHLAEMPAIVPADPPAWSARATALRSLGRLVEAVASLDAALAATPDDALAVTARRAIVDELRDKLLTRPAPNNAHALLNRARILGDLGRFDAAIACCEQALHIQPDLPLARGEIAAITQAICDFARAEAAAAWLASAVRDGSEIAEPFALLTVCDDPALHLRCAKAYVEAFAPRAPRGARRAGSAGEPTSHRLRIAYLSADFRRNAMAFFIARLIARHDRAHFEVFAVSTGNDDASAERQRIAAGADQFIDVAGWRDEEIAELLAARKVDILVDLNGHTQGGRLGVLARRSAPIQVSYVGYPGAMGAEFIDYVIGDRIVLPDDSEPWYSERIARLQDCYLAYDPLVDALPPAPERRAVGLPERGFVFCCFNSNYKITRPVFDMWMRLLRAVDASVLWLLSEPPAAEPNLRRAAAAQGVDPARLVFAPRVGFDHHLSRLRLADLCLDTLPVNAHTTACDALWMGLPLVTCTGRAFAGRVAASVLTSVGLPELVTTSFADYQALALGLATDPSRLRRYRDHLTRNRASLPLFDPDRLARQIEAAYSRMWDTWRRGEPAQSFNIEQP